MWAFKGLLIIFTTMATIVGDIVYLIVADVWYDITMIIPNDLYNALCTPTSSGKTFSYDGNQLLNYSNDFKDIYFFGAAAQSSENYVVTFAPKKTHYESNWVIRSIIHRIDKPHYKAQRCPGIDNVLATNPL